MVKKTSKPKPATTKEPDAPQYDQIVGLRKTKIEEIAVRIAEIANEMKALKDEKDNLNAAGASILLKHKIRTVMVGELRVTQYDGVNRNLSRTKLVENGVGVDVIEKSYNETPYSTLKVTAKKEEE